MPRKTTRSLRRAPTTAVALAITLACALLGSNWLSRIVTRSVFADTASFDLLAGNLTQGWTNTSLISAPDNWSAVPSITGYLGVFGAQPDNVDPQTVTDPLAAASQITVDANETQSPNTYSAGDVVEFDTLPNPTVALAASATADFPNLVIYLNTMGRTSVTVQYNVRDLDASADDGVKQVATQYRIGNTSVTPDADPTVYTNLPTGFVADATTPNAATQVTPVLVVLPPEALNQPEVEVRIITSNNAGTDEIIGIDDIVVTSTGGTPTPSPTPTPTPTPTPSPTPTPTPSPTPTPTSTVQFSAGVFTVAEECGTGALITVTRSGDTGVAGTVDFATSDGTALQKSDYTKLAGTLNFGAGETSKTFMVLITEDSYVEGNESLTLTLSNPTGGVSLGAQNSATLTITDDDTTNPPTVNPIDNAQTFVCQHYHDFLSREADANGLAFWTDQITSCGTNTQCIELRRINVSAAFFLSIEFQETGYLVHRIYKAAYGNLSGTPVPVTYNEFLPDTQRIGQGVVVGQTGWEQVLENNKQVFTAAFVARSRFATAHPPTMTPAQFVNALFSNAGVTPSVAERQTAIDEFGGATTTGDLAARARALRRVAENSTLVQQEFNRAFVLMQYFGYLRRNPNDAPDANFDGYDFWLNKLNQFNGNFINAEMVKAFIISGEYRQRFGP